MHAIELETAAVLAACRLACHTCLPGTPHSMQQAPGQQHSCAQAVGQMPCPQTTAIKRGEGDSSSCLLVHCSAGTWEPFSQDQANFPESVKGANYPPPFEFERWLDVRSPIVRNLMRAVSAERWYRHTARQLL